MIEVARYLDRVQADLACSRLEASGIHARVFADNEGNMAPYLSYLTGVRVLVRQEDLEEAKEVLALPPPSANGDSEGEHHDHEEAPTTKAPLHSPESSARRLINLGIIGTFLAPGIGHLISLIGLLLLIPRHDELTTGTKRHMTAVLIYDVAFVAGAALFIAKLGS